MELKNKKTPSSFEKVLKKKLYQLTELGSNQLTMIQEI